MPPGPGEGPDVGWRGRRRGNLSPPAAQTWRGRECLSTPVCTGRVQHPLQLPGAATRRQLAKQGDQGEVLGREGLEVAGRWREGRGMCDEGV